MSDYCEDCGCKVYNGACTNCHEEVYIYEQHLADPCCELSDEFLKKVAEQKADIQKQKSEGRTYRG